MSDWMKELERIVDEHDPIPDCDCKRCAITERDRLRAALLAHAAQRDVHQLDDINVADLMQADDSSKERVQSVGPCKQINSGHVCGAPRRGSERICPDCNPQSVELPEPVAFAVFAENGNVRIWSTDSEPVRKLADASGVPLTPLVARDPARTYGDAREAAGYARGLKEAGKDAERYRLLRDGRNWPAAFARHDAPEPLTGVDLDAAIDAALAG